MYPSQIKAGLPTRKWLTAAGDGTGTFNLNGNYSASPTDFFYLATTTFYLRSLIIAISDNANFNQIDYGAIPGGLTNGVGFFFDLFNGPELRLINTTNIKQNFEWLAIIEKHELTQFAGLPQTLTIVLDIVNEFGTPFVMNAGDKFIVRLNDDFSTLVSHTFGIKGIQAV